MLARRALVLFASLATLGLLVTLSQPLQAQVTPQSGRVITPLCRTGCGGNGSAVSVTPQGTYTDTVVSYLDSVTATSVSFTVTNTGGDNDTYTLTMSCSNTTCVSQSYTSVSLAPSASIGVTVTFQAGPANSTGTVSRSS